MSIIFRILARLSRIYRKLKIRSAAPGELKFMLANDPDAELRRLALIRLGGQVGAGTYLNPGVRLVSDHPKKATLVLGERVAVAPNVTFVCNSGPCYSRLRDSCAYVRDHLVKRATITVGDDSWLGANVTILPGVTIGKNCIIGAGAVVVKDCPDNTVWAGVPARQIRTLEA